MNEEIINQFLIVADPIHHLAIDDIGLLNHCDEVVHNLQRLETSGLRRFWRKASRWKKLFVAGVATLSLFLFGTGTSLVARNLLDDFWNKSISALKCEVSGDNAHLVRSGVDSLGTETQYWNVKSDSSVVDVIIRKSKIDGVSGGTSSCDHHPRSEGKPFIALSMYAGNDRIPHVTFYGWLPAGTTGIVEMASGEEVSVKPNTDGDVLSFVDLSSSEIGMRQLTVFGIDGKVQQVISLQPKE